MNTISIKLSVTLIALGIFSLAGAVILGAWHLAAISIMSAILSLRMITDHKNESNGKSQF